MDVKDVGLVVNYDLPNEPEAYVHRIGRTGRAGADGMAVSFCAEDEIDFLREIEKIIKNSIPRLTDHAWHSEALNEKHIRGFRPPAVKQGGRGGQGGGGGNRRGGGSSGSRGRNARGSARSA